MAKKAPFNDLAFRPAEEGKPLAAWLYEELRAAILDGRLKSGIRLPSTRQLAVQYKVARGTVIAAFAPLLEEGYLDARQGSGSYVAANLPDQFFHAAGDHRPSFKTAAQSTAGLSRWGAQLTATFPPRTAKELGLPFEANLPALDLFPISLWGRLAGRRMRQASHKLLGASEAAGYLPLREAVADYLGSARGVKCTAGQVVIVSGTQQTLQLIARLVLNRDDQVWLEDPGYVGALAAFKAAEAQVVAVPVDDHGMDVDSGQRLAPRAKLAYISPAHQFPLGVSLSLERRLALLRWAQKAGAWIFEDDYDSEYRFTGRPLPSLQSLDASGCVIFAGSFNKMLFPTLRLGYVVLPPRLVQPFLHARSMSDRFAPVLDQAVLCDFFTEGHFGQHIRRMREAYAERLAALLNAAQGPLAGLLDIRPIQAGMQAAAILPASHPDRAASLAAAAHGVEASPLSVFQIQRTDVNGLLLGFANATPAAIHLAAKRLAAALRAMPG
ncbi:MAG: transcriptional regulator, GntR family with aminotransferase domain [Verrucomicrobiaceae bacterium]|nr:transcriptional regulator, GntR family with aminotransferase domain [Verrucomicrobiaceae bacterium]